MTKPEEHVCKSCGNPFTGLYCNHCGEKIILPQDRSFRSFLTGIFVALTFTDTKVLKTAWLTVANPGFLSREFSEGRRIKYLRPMSLFFLLNLIYFLFPIIQLFSATLRTQLNSFHGKYAVAAIASKMTALGIHDIGSFELVYDQKTAGLAKMLVILFAVLVSLPLNLIYWTRNRYFSDHVTFSVELVCFNLFINTILLSLGVRLLHMGSFTNEFGLTAILLVTNVYFLLRAGYTFYEDRGVKLIGRTLIMVGVLRICIEAYRAILFYVTIWSL